MSRKNKIIISVTGIILVLLILVGLTYAYFLTKIKGNDNEKSISITTADLKLEYSDINDILVNEENVEPGNSWTKTFAVTNNGNKTVTNYGVALENIENRLERKEDLVYTLTCIQYTKATYKVENKVASGTTSGTCNGVSSETTYPSVGTILVENSIDTDKVQAYTLTVTYKETNTDQSVDMNKRFSGKVNIVDPKLFGPFGTDTLASTIINTAKTQTDSTRTTLGTEVTTFTGISGANDHVLNTAPDDYGTSYYFYGNVIDNYVEFGNLTYKEDIYVGDEIVEDFFSLSECEKLNNSCKLIYKAGESILWRIVRINGDGTIRLVLDDVAKDSSGRTITTDFNPGYEDTAENAYVGYMYGTLGSTTYDATHENKNDSTIKVAVDKWYEDNLKTNYASYLSDTLFCGDKTLAENGIGGVTTQLGYVTNVTYYSSTERLLHSSGTTDIITSKPTLKCAEKTNDNYSRYTINQSTLPNGKETNGDLKYPIGLLSADEVAYAGAYKYNQANKTYYLYSSSIYSPWWLSSPSVYDIGFAGVWGINGENGRIDTSSVYGSLAFRPTINLKQDIKFTGTGTSTDPYKIVSE